MKSSTMCLFDKLNDHVTNYRNRFNNATAQCKQDVSSVQDAEQELKDAVEAQRILQTLAQTIQQNVHGRLSTVVSHSLNAVFDDPYRLHIEFEQKRGKTEAIMTFQRRNIIADPLTAAGGGVVDVASFALRLACLTMRRPELQRVVFLDEPFKFIWKGYIPRIRKLLQDLSHKMGFQFVIVTHIEELKLGTVIRLGDASTPIIE